MDDRKAEQLFNHLTPAQRAFFITLTDQRVANMVLASDLIGDLDAGAYSVLRAINEEDRKALRRFMWECRPETLEFLTNLRDREVDELSAAVEFYIALKRTMKVLRWSIVTLAGAFLGMSLLWEKIGRLFRHEP